LRLGYWIKSQARNDLLDLLPEYWSFKIGDEISDNYGLEVAGYYYYYYYYYY